MNRRKIAPKRGSPITVWVKPETRVRLVALKSRWGCKNWAELLRVLVGRAR